MAIARLKNTGKAVKLGQPKCGKCGKEIQPGEQRYEWKYRYGGTHVRCTDHRPRPSETTQGNISQLYAAQEDVQDAMAGAPTTVEELEDAISDLQSALGTAAGTALDMASEYETAADAFGGGGDNRDRADACENWASELEQVTLPDPADVDDDQAPESIEDVWQQACDAAQEALDALEI